MSADGTHPGLTEKRRAFVQHLYRLHADLTGEPYRAAKARAQLAKLRRSFAGPKQEADAYEVVFPFDPPVKEQESWLLIAGLFALHPHAKTAPNRSIGAAMRLLASKRGAAATQRRFTQLLSVDVAALPHYLRQAVQLLRSGEVAIDYRLLLDDLLTIRSSAEKAREVRLRWAREYHRPDPKKKTPGGPEPAPASDAAAQPADA